jgi:hypothetical protein
MTGKTAAAAAAGSGRTGSRQTEPEARRRRPPAAAGRLLGGPRAALVQDGPLLRLELAAAPPAPERVCGVRLPTFPPAGPGFCTGPCFAPFGSRTSRPRHPRRLPAANAQRDVGRLTCKVELVN